LLLSFRPPVERTAKAAPEQPALHFVRLGAAVATFDLPALLRLTPVTDIIGEDPYYEQRKHFKALSLEPLLAAAFSEPLAALRQRDFLLRARDGYAVPLPGGRLLEGGAYLAFADAEVADWAPIGPQRAHPGPFYLVWARPEQGRLATHPRPWQLASIEIVDGEQLFPHAVPRGVGHDSLAARGARLFRGRCIACHAINREGGRVGPDLNVPQSIIEYRPRAQIRAYIREPLRFRYGTMPAHPDLTEAQLDDLVEYFAVMSTQKYDPAPRPPRAGEPPPGDGGSR
jgi:mono/diheme cytochrome c family protein